jgi:hypothetical protein
MRFLFLKDPTKGKSQSRNGGVLKRRLEHMARRFHLVRLRFINETEWGITTQSQRTHEKSSSLFSPYSLHHCIGSTISPIRRSAKVLGRKKEGLPFLQFALLERLTDLTGQLMGHQLL